MVHYLQQLLKVVVVQVRSVKLFGSEIGKVQSLKIIESGVNINNHPALSMRSKLVVTGVSGTFEQLILFQVLVMMVQQLCLVLLFL